MESIIDNQLIMDHVLQYLSLDHKLRLRKCKYFANQIESWMRRFNRRLDLKRSLTNAMAVEILSLSPLNVDSLIINIHFSKDIWPVIKEKISRARELHFKYAFLDSYSKWRQRIHFRKLECESVIVDAWFRDTIYPKLFADLANCPRLKTIHLSRVSDLDEIRYLMRNEDIPQSLKEKVRLGSTPYICSKYELLETLNSFPSQSLQELNISLTDWEFNPMEIEEDALREVANVFQESDAHGVERLRVETPYELEHRVMVKILRKWPKLR